MKGQPVIHHQMMVDQPVIHHQMMVDQPVIHHHLVYLKGDAIEYAFPPFMDLNVIGNADLLKM
jgi:hypothetical protein